MSIVPTIHSASILFVEDHPGFASLLQLLLHEIGVAAVYSAPSFAEGLRLYHQTSPDICLFDIDLGANQPTGIQLAAAVREEDPLIPIIFLTSHYTDDYYEQVRSLRPSSFLNKEFSKLKLHQALDLALLQRELVHHEDSDKTPDQGKDKITYFPAARTEHLFFKIGDSFKRFHINEIDYFFAKDKLTYARIGNRNFPTSVQLKVLEEELCNHFIRIHKGYLINIESIDTIHPGESNVQIGEEILPVGHVYRKAFLERLNLLK